MSVRKGDRRDSKVEFDNTYFKIHDDAVRLIKNKFGASKDIREEAINYIRVSSTKILNDILDIGKYIRIANSIYPKNKSELEERRVIVE